MAEMAIYNRLKILIAEKELRDGQKWPYRTIAPKIGVSTATLSAYVNQKAHRFDAPTLEAFCKFFGCQPGDILVFTDTPPAPKE